MYIYIYYWYIYVIEHNCFSTLFLIFLKKKIIETDNEKAKKNNILPVKRD